ncbi:MAG: hypothetical protein WC539_05920 [Nitrospirota bacterium]
MNFLFFFLLIVFGSSVPVYAADTPVERAMKLYEKHRYEEATRVLTADASHKHGAADLTLGMIYLQNARLHYKLYRESLAVSQEYLKKLARIRGKGKSRFADLYMGLSLMEAGKHETAVSHLESFSADEKVSAGYRDLAKINLGYCHFRLGDKQKAETLWKSVNSENPELNAERASVYSMAGLQDRNPSVLLDESLAALKKSGKTPSLRMIRNALAIYVKDGRIDKGLALVSHSDMKAYSYKETISRTKIIHFYDPSLIGLLATLYSQASIARLEKALADPGVKDPATYYISEAYALSAYDKNRKQVDFSGTRQLPAKYQDRMRVWQAFEEYRKGRRTEAFAIWNELGRKQPFDPDLNAALLDACVRAETECSQIVKRSETGVASGKGRTMSGLNSALGTYYRVKKKPLKALAFMEAGRDKSNKNKIEYNDPVLLVNLAGMYYQSKKFSEALEIYFEMSKQFPVVRQIQEVMQGVYAMEQKSAGDVKIF